MPVDLALQALLEAIATIAAYNALTLDKLPQSFNFTLPDGTTVTYQRTP